MESLEYTLREFGSDTWLIGLVVCCMLILSVAAHLYQESFRSFLSLPISNRYFIVAGKPQNSGHPFSLLLFTVGIIGLSLFLTLLLNQFDFKIGLDLMSFLQVLAAVFGFIGVKVFIERMIGIVFNLESVINGYVFEKLTFLNLISVGLLGVSVICTYAFNGEPMVLYVALGLSVVAYTVGLFYSYKNNEKLIYRNFFYFILYLCALEISPILLMYKALT